jgi:hypothetical protein
MSEGKAKCVCCGKFVSGDTSRAKSLGMRFVATDAMSESVDKNGRMIYDVLCNYCKEPFIIVDPSVNKKSSIGGK